MRGCRPRGVSNCQVRVKKNRKNADGVGAIPPDYDGPPPPGRNTVVSDLSSNPTEYDTMSSEDDDMDASDQTFRLSIDETHEDN